MTVLRSCVVFAVIAVQDLEALEETVKILSDATLMAELRIAHLEPTEAWRREDLMDLIARKPRSD